jgi:hypothetical protein
MREGGRIYDEKEPIAVLVASKANTIPVGEASASMLLKSKASRL